MLTNYIIPSIITIALIVVYVVVFKKVFAKKENKNLPVIILWALLVLAEIWKISFLIARDGVFNPIRYPLVFCSIIMYTVPIFAFKENKYSNLARFITIFTSIGASLAFFATAWQNTLSVMQIHSYFYHGSMMAISVYLLAVKQYKYNFNDYFKVFLFVAVYIVFNSVLGMYLGTYISLFGPTSSYTGFVHDMFGFVAGNTLIIVVAFLLCLGVFSIINLFVKNGRKKGEVKND